MGATEACRAWQTRLPGELASTLEGIASEYEADLLVGPAGSDSEEDVAAWGLFPARQLLEAINAAIQVLRRCRVPVLMSCRARRSLPAALQCMIALAGQQCVLLHAAPGPMTAVLTGCAGLMAWQAAKPAERGALAQQAEALVAVAAAHADGKESYARGIATELLEDFLAVEERFAAAREATEQEVIDSLRQVRFRSRAMPAE